MKKAILYVIVFAAIQMGASSIVMALWKIITGSADVTAPMLIVSMTLFSVGVLAVFLLAKWCVLSPNYLRMRQWGVFIWCVLAALGAIIPSIWFQEQMPELPNILGDEFDMILRNPFGYAVVGLLAPFVEELVFRGAILRSLLEWTKRQWVAIAISALLFALIHGNPAQMPHAFIIGLLLGWMYYRTGSIIPGVVYHWVNNSVAFIMYNMMPDSDIPLIVFFNGSSQAVTVALVSSLCILIPSIFQLHLRMRKS